MDNQKALLALVLSFIEYLRAGLLGNQLDQALPYQVPSGKTLISGAAISISISSLPESVPL